jgi:alkylated DNA nucleotide flippase Atl1
VTADAAPGDSGTLKPTWSATDASGVESVTATLDGVALKTGSTVELWRLPLGAHTLVVTATDKAGVSATKSLAFSTVTSFRDVAALVGQFRQGKQVTAVGAVLLQAQLLEARVHGSRGRTVKAVAALNRFRTTAGLKNVVKDATVSAALKRDAAALIVQVQAP